MCIKASEVAETCLVTWIIVAYLLSFLKNQDYFEWFWEYRFDQEILLKLTR